MTNLSYLIKYPTQGATSRYRSFAFASRLAEKNYNIELQSFMDIRYLENLFSGRPKNILYIVLSYGERLFALLRSSSNLIIEREALPYLPYAIEQLFLANKRYILDFDDNVWEDYRNKLFLDKKYDRLVQNASGVIVGNRFLEEYVKNLNPNTIKIPTVINLDTYRMSEPIQKFEKLTLIWIGSSVTYKYIKLFSSIFQELTRTIDFDLIIIASESLQHSKIDGVSMKFYDWSSETEINFLQRSHIGIMPLSEDSFSQGKSGFKLVQYMAAGLPMIASPIGENCSIVEHGINGFLPTNTAEWIDALSKLSDPVIYSSFSKKSLEKSYDFSIQKYFPIYKQFIDKTFQENM